MKMLQFCPSSPGLSSIIYSVVSRDTFRGSSPTLNAPPLSLKTMKLNEEDEKIAKHSPWRIPITTDAMSAEILPLRGDGGVIKKLLWRSSSIPGS